MPRRLRTKVSTVLPSLRSTKRRRSAMLTVSVNGFGGGWNAVDNDLSMNPKFLVTAKNFRRTPSGSQVLRYGTQWFADVSSTLSGAIVDGTYFNNRNIVVMDTGEIGTTTDAGVVAKIWDTAIAAALPGAPSGWSTGLDSINFVPFKDKLIIHNGVDKPLIIDSSFAVTYLQDEATGSNVNVPVGKYGCVASNYHIVAGIPSQPTTIYIASVGTSGTFQGDPDPNDSVSIDVGAYTQEGSAAIRGIAGFRNFLIIFFRGQSLVMQLGVYDSDGNHAPTFNDTLPHFGILGHRCYVESENDLLFADQDGLNSGRRNLLVTSVDSEHLSAMITPEFQGTLGGLTNTEALKQTFLVEDRLNRSVLLFEPSGRVFAYHSDEKLKYKSWSEYDYGESWTCGWTSFLGRMFLAKGTRIFKSGNLAFGETYHADHLNDRDGNWANNTAYSEDDLIYDTSNETVYICRVSHTSAALGTFEADRTANETYWEEYEGEEIEFDLELPWLQGQDPMKGKQNRFASIVSKGDASFTFEVYVDNLYKDVDGEIVHDPALTMDFIGNEAGGFGTDPGPFGGGRRSMDPRLFAFPVNFKIIKPRVYGATKNKLEIVGFAFLYVRGSYQR